MNVALNTIAVVLVIFTAVSLLRAGQWWIRGFDFPRAQFSVLLAIVIALQLVFFETASLLGVTILVLAIVALAYQLWWVIPYTALYRREVKSASQSALLPQLSLMTANVLMHNREYDRLLKLIDENAPDVLVTLESDKHWEEHLSVIEKDYPYTIKCPLDNLYGMHVYSRLPLLNSQIEYLVEEDIPSMHAKLQITSQAGIRMHFLHPAPPSPTENEESTERDAELLQVARSLADFDEPVIVTGDLNDVAWSYTTRLFRKVSGLLDPRVGRGMYNTFNAKYWLVRWPLDHLFHSEHFTVVEMRRLPAFGSDHFALYAKLSFDHNSLIEQEGLEAEHEDLEEAKEIINAPSVEVGEVPKV